MIPASAKRAAVSEARRTLSARSAGEKPRSRVSPVRRLSPSMRYTFLPRRKMSSCSSFSVMVVLPEPERPVNQRVTPFWPMRWKRRLLSARQSLPGAHSRMFCPTVAWKFANMALRYSAATLARSGSGQPLVRESGSSSWGHTGQSGHFGQLGGGQSGRGHDGHCGHSAARGQLFMASVIAPLTSGQSSAAVGQLSGALLVDLA
mmetsp:Transcript_11113/g.37839  ORF Transcript_11113/g.37839 Transcript_11113/m.37839 type:complete len:204 (+) Transcript_11113:2535-3146(+)